MRLDYDCVPMKFVCQLVLRFNGGIVDRVRMAWLRCSSSSISFFSAAIWAIVLIQASLRFMVADKGCAFYFFHLLFSGLCSLC